VNFLKRIFGGIAAMLSQYFRSGKAAADAKWVLEHLPEALVCIDKAMPIVTGLIPGPADDVIWGVIRAKYPAFFDGSIKTVDELKAADLVAAAELLRSLFPSISTTMSRAAIELAYLDRRGQ